ncbi:hypothetical protein HOLleu_17992 [Holothuria leucospilota]|uniref:Reverse transcriptase RNase H-like domain-containing protein n=1 Tax=Holothuria leucospilota TaxID=206669 RepID=A0A9Q1H996_HOLLE|nr:hypothetical protein HOLleu_17992 [Holothuria leucospilota]
MQTWPRPINKTEVRRFLGICTYYRRFVENFASIAKPLHRLTEKGREFLWNQDCEGAFICLERRLTTSPVLAYPLREGKFVLDTDASDFGVGAVLSQQQGQTERVIAYFSKTLGKAERRYCVTRKELLAIILAVKHFHHYLFGTKFLVRTDHGALRWLLRFRNPEGQIARWIETLGNYNFEIQYRPARVHGNADALSRRPCGECSKCEREESKETLRSATDQGEELVNCPRLQEVKLCRSLEGPTAKAPEGATEEEPEEKPEGELEEKPGEQPEEEPEEKPEGEANNETTSSTPLENKPTWPGVWSVANLRELQQRDEDTCIMSFVVSRCLSRGGVDPPTERERLGPRTERPGKEVLQDLFSRPNIDVETVG